MALFGSSHPQQNDALMRVSAELSVIQRRVDLLSKDADSIEAGVKARDEKMASDFDDMEAQLKILSQEIKHLRKLMKALMRYAQTLILRLQAKAKKEDFEKIQRLVDEWAPEQYITKREFIGIVARELKKELIEK